MSRFFLFKIIDKKLTINTLLKQKTQKYHYQFGKVFPQTGLHCPNLGKIPRKKFCIIPIWESLPRNRLASSQIGKPCL